MLIEYLKALQLYAFIKALFEKLKLRFKLLIQPVVCVIINIHRDVTTIDFNIPSIGHQINVFLKQIVVNSKVDIKFVEFFAV